MKYPYMQFHLVNRLVLVALSGSLLAFAGCSTLPLVVDERDSGPSKPLSVDHIPEPVPRYEPRTRAGNYSPYTVLGKTYHVMDNPDGYRERGVASWYGNKFHGRRTSNGEIYDMYAVTAAHKTLPIPSYVRVTNLANNRSIIVRVNDRGPFHGDRIIDLSYTAARKLGYANAGTAHVTVEYIDPKKYAITQPGYTVPVNDTVIDGVAPAPTPVDAGGYQLPEGTFLQVGAFGSLQSAQAMQQKINALTYYPVIILRPGEVKAYKDKFYRVQIGPIDNNLALITIQDKVIKANLPEPHVVNRTQ